jgi:predicted  nucleic acid-binding Zn-ribbon protein
MADEIKEIKKEENEINENTKEQDLSTALDTDKDLKKIVDERVKLALEAKEELEINIEEPKEDNKNFSIWKIAIIGVGIVGLGSYFILKNKPLDDETHDIQPMSEQGVNNERE